MEKLSVLLIICIFSNMNITEAQITLTSGTFYEPIHRETAEDSSKDRDSSFLSEEMFSCSGTADCSTIGKLKNDDKYKKIPQSEEKNKKKYEIMWKKVKSGFTDCKEAQKRGMDKDGIIEISWKNGSAFQGHCNMAIDGGGWTVFQRRVDKGIDFFRNWTEYVNGFGQLDGSFWLGLEAIHQLTENKTVTLRIDLKNLAGEVGNATYDDFKVLSLEKKYKLKIGAYQGNIGDSLIQSNNMAFSTQDKDSDNNSGHNCALEFEGPWWHDACFKANLNNHLGNDGTAIDTPDAPNAGKMSWFTWRNTYGDIIYSEMKLRAKD